VVLGIDGLRRARQQHAQAGSVTAGGRYHERGPALRVPASRVSAAVQQDLL
jgi:hypothetical protein